MAQLNHEPSMEDILASIKRIIAEDGETAAPRPQRAPRRENAAADVIEQEPEVEPVAFEAAPEPEAAPERKDEIDGVDVLELTSPIADELPTPAEAPPAPAHRETAIAKEPAAVDRIISDPALAASRSAFAALSQLQVRAEAGQENSLEGLVADLLRPMLREWLDRELPAMVERLVTEEIARVSGRA